MNLRSPGPWRASVLAIALPRAAVARLFAVLNDEEIRSLTKYVEQLGPVDRASAEVIYSDFVNRMQVRNLAGSTGSTESLLANTLPKERAVSILDEMSGPMGRTVWEKLDHISDQILASFLKSEYPQTISVILSMLKASHSARILAHLPDGLAIETIGRMVQMDVVKREIVLKVENVLKKEFTSSLARTSIADSLDLVASIFNNLERKRGQHLLNLLREQSEYIADDIQAQMFTFGDIAQLTPESIQRLLQLVNREQLALALKGASEEAKQLFTKQMPARASKMLQDAISILGRVKVKQVEDAQASIAFLAHNLVIQGEIEFTGEITDSIF